MKPEDRYRIIKGYLEDIRRGILNPVALPNLEGHIYVLFQQHIKSRDEARTDTLTGLPNYRGLSEILEREEARSNRHKEPLTVGFVDFDNLKSYNDTYGHIQADHAICSVSQTIRKSLRKQDILGRYTKGDEFCLVLPNTDLERARIVVDRALEAVDQLSIDAVVKGFPDDNYKKVTISGGCTQLKETEDYLSALNRADKAMQTAKATTRQRSSVTYV